MYREIISLMKTILLLFLIAMNTTQAFSQKPKEILYVGTYDLRGSEGIYVLEFDRVRGRFKKIQAVKTPASPTFLAIHPSGKFLYSVNRGSVEEMPNSGSISSFSIDPKTGMLTLLNQRPSYGTGPCHISFDKTGKWIFVSNYTEGNFVILPIFDDGLIGSSSDSRKHIGKSIHPERQQKSFVHSSLPSPDNQYVLVADLGADEIHSYKFDSKSGRIISEGSSVLKVTPGCGPRHFTFHPNGKIVYVAEEVTSTVGVFGYNSATGKLTVVKDSIPSLPEDFKGANTAADIHTDARGTYLYMSNRGLDALSIFSINKTGMINRVGQQNTKGKTPRNFFVDMKGDYLFVANQDTDNVVIYRRDLKTGKLKDTQQQVKIPAPVCLKMITVR